VYITLLPEVVLQHGAHETTAGGRCERVQKQQTGIPVRPLKININDGNPHLSIRFVCGGHHKQLRLKKVNFDNLWSKLRVAIRVGRNYELVEGKNM